MTITSYVEESPTKKQFTLDIPVAQVAEATDLAARHFARNLAIPGFRKGKVPLDLVKKRFEEEIRAEALEQLIDAVVQEALQEKGLHPVGNPKVEDLKAERGTPVTFRLEVEVRPQVTPKDYRGLKVPTEPTTPTPEEVDLVVDKLRAERASFEPVEDRPAADGDFALVDLRGVFPGGDGKDFESQKMLVEIGGAETMSEMTANLRNAEPGVTVTFQKDFPESFEDETFAGKTVLYHVTLVALKKQLLPELDDAFATVVLTPRQGEPPQGASLALLREKVTESLAHEKEHALTHKRRRAALDGLLALNDVAAPDSMVEAEVDSALKEYARTLSRQGVDLKEAKIDWQRLREEARPSSIRRVKEYLLLDAIGEAEDVRVTDTELDGELKRRAAQMGTPFSELKAALAKAERLEGVREDIRLDRVVELLLREAVPAV